MLGTIVLEKYKKEETLKVLKSLELLIYENSNDWSTAGIYCYWDYYTKDILYFGLAINLIERFKQHNGLIKCNPKSCKINKINTYFEKKEYLGFTIMLQSAFSQPLNYREKRKYSKSFDEKELINILGEQGSESIRRMEGILLESHKINYGNLPKWNEVGGAKEGQNSVKPIHQKILNLFVKEQENKYVALVSLMELSENNKYCFFECYLHSIRISPYDTTQAIEFNKQITGLDIYSEIRNSGYFGKRLKL